MAQWPFTRGKHNGRVSCPTCKERGPFSEAIEHHLKCPDRWPTIPENSSADRLLGDACQLVAASTKKDFLSTIHIYYHVRVKTGEEWTASIRADNVEVKATGATLEDALKSALSQIYSALSVKKQ